MPWPGDLAARVCGRICGGMALCGIGLLLLFAVATVADGLSRSLLNWPIDAVRDVGGLVAAVAVSFCFPIAFWEGRNITLHAADRLFGPLLRRVIEVAGAFIVLGVLGLFTAEFVRFAADAWRGGDITVTLQVPTAPFWFTVAAAFSVTTAVQAVLTVRTLARGGQRVAVP